jgi:hypothetical protein
MPYSLEIHILELPKLRPQPFKEDWTSLERWCLCLDNLRGELMERIAAQDPLIGRALTVEDVFAKVDEERYLYELRERNRHDYNHFPRGRGCENPPRAKQARAVDAMTMNRYARITEKFPREFLLLKGRGCFHGKCLFCDYHLDACDDPFAENRRALDRVTGEFGTLDIINSGSVHELDEQTLRYIQKITEQKNIGTLWFEAHYAYRARLEEIRRRFPNRTVKFRTGVESFDDGFRRAMNKGMPDVLPEEVRQHFDGVCLLVGVLGQTRESIERDVGIAARLFEYFSVNLFCPNTTPVERDAALAAWFLRELCPRLQHLANCEVLLNNTDLGVG